MSDGRITDEDIERARRQIGVPQHERNPVFNRNASEDSISHFAFGIGDDNPLFHDDAYGRTTRWRSQIASPLYLTTTGLDETPPPDEERKALFRGLFRGVGKYYSGTRWRWFRPVYPGDIVYREYATYDVQVKEASAFALGRTVLDSYEYIYADRSGGPLAHRVDTFVNAERTATREAGKHAGVTRQRFTPEDIARIDEQYANERRRGAEVRWWEDVEIGDRIDPIVKGPLAITDIVGFHIGWGFGQTYGVGPLKYASRLRRRMPAFFSTDTYGVPDVVQRLHWDAGRALELGLPAPYDYGTMRTNWLAHMLTNWIGDDGWLASLATEIRAFNFVGDVTVCSGEVTGKRRDDAGCWIDADVRGTNQRGDVTCPGSASVLLPSRELGPVVLPEPPGALRRRGAALVARGAGRPCCTAASKESAP